MKLYHGLSSFSALAPSVVSSGTFDGLHFGHRKVVERLKEKAKKHGLESTLMTFWPHPRIVLGKAKGLKLLSTLDEKIILFRDLSIDNLVIIEFDKKFADISSSDFIQKILIEKLNTQKLVIGYDHRFGKNREGGFDYLQQHQAALGFSVEEIPRQELAYICVSSSQIREALSAGQIAAANRYLGRPYSLSGLVVKGTQIGRKIGFPTANLQIEDNYKLIPKSGVYVVKIEINKNKFGGMINIGKNPTISTQNKETLEVHIFDFKEDIYQKKLRVSFLKRIRSEQKFDCIEMLKNQLKKDKIYAQKILSQSC